MLPDLNVLRQSYKTETNNTISMMIFLTYRHFYNLLIINTCKKNTSHKTPLKAVEGRFSSQSASKIVNRQTKIFWGNLQFALYLLTTNQSRQKLMKTQRIAIILSIFTIIFTSCSNQSRLLANIDSYIQAQSRTSALLSTLVSLKWSANMVNHIKLVYFSVNIKLRVYADFTPGLYIC